MPEVVWATSKRGGCLLGAEGASAGFLPDTPVGAIGEVTPAHTSEETARAGRPELVQMLMNQNSGSRVDVTKFSGSKATFDGVKLEGSNIEWGPFEPPG